jgi:outer membrane protein OmpA-like peptidoglycan-associated protein
MFRSRIDSVSARFAVRLSAASAVLIAALCTPVPAYAERFMFLYETGDQYRMISTVDERVYFNGQYSHRADILNKISVRVTGVSEGSGTLSVLFQTSERSYGGTGLTYDWAEEYRSEFGRDRFGVYDIRPEYYMPVLRDVPVFPDRDLAPGDTWVGKAEEVHDLRRVFNIPEAFHIPITVTYEYLGPERFEGIQTDVFSVEYSLFYRPPRDLRRNPMYPVLIMGSSKQKLYWDREKGRPHYSVEEFDLVWELASGDRIEYIGTADGKVIESPTMDKEGVASELRRALSESGVRDTEVTAVENGVTITLENVRFQPDSAELTAEERGKLTRIGAILMRYPDRDILITGHTALAGTPEGRMRLSLERAKAVGEYLLSIGVSSPENLVVKGMGAEDPVMDNSTEAGRRMNRRVEITILEN